MRHSLLLAGVCVWALFASPAEAIPVAYAFTAYAGTGYMEDGSTYPDLASGTFSYDGDTHLATLSFVVTPPHDSRHLFAVDISGVVAPIVYPGDGERLPIPGKQHAINGWPDVRDAFPYVFADVEGLRLAGGSLFDGEQLRHGLTLSDLEAPGGGNANNMLWITWDSVNFYGNSCTPGTPSDLCPPSSFPYHDDYGYLYTLTDLHEIPVPEPAPESLAVLALGGLAAVGMARRAS